MKNLFLIFIATLTNVAIGQLYRIDAGIQGGPGYKSLYGNRFLENNKSAGLGFSAGLTFQYNLSKIFAINTGISFERKGSFFKGVAYDVNRNPIGNYRMHGNYDYLTIPLLLRASVGKKIRFYINAGPFFGYLIKQTDISRVEGIGKIKRDNTSTMHQTDMGVSTGAGMIIPLNERLNLSGEIRNNRGLYNISKDPIISNGELKTNYTNLILGLNYRFRKQK